MKLALKVIRDLSWPEEMPYLSEVLISSNCTALL